MSSAVLSLTSPKGHEFRYQRLWQCARDGQKDLHCLWPPSLSLHFQTLPRWTMQCPPPLCCSRWVIHIHTPTWARSPTPMNSSLLAKSSTSTPPWRLSVSAILFLPSLPTFLFFPDLSFQLCCALFSIFIISLFLHLSLKICLFTSFSVFFSLYLSVILPIYTFWVSLPGIQFTKDQVKTYFAGWVGQDGWVRGHEGTISWGGGFVCSFGPTDTAVPPSFTIYPGEPSGNLDRIQDTGSLNAFSFSG